MPAFHIIPPAISPRTEGNPRVPRLPTGCCPPGRGPQSVELQKTEGKLQKGPWCPEICQVRNVHVYIYIYIMMYIYIYISYIYWSPIWFLNVSCLFATLWIVLHLPISQHHPTGRFFFLWRVLRGFYGPRGVPAAPLWEGNHGNSVSHGLWKRLWMML